MGQRKIKIAKHVLDQKVAVAMGRRKAEVSLITEIFLEEVRQALVEQGEVQLDGVGTLKVIVSKPQGNGNLIPRQGQRLLPALKEPQRRVSFRKSQPLRVALRKCGSFKEHDHGEVRSRRVG